MSVLFLGALISVDVQAKLPGKDKITLERVLEYSADHFPDIKIALARIAEQEGDVLESLGAFDASVESSYYRRLNGFYSGRISDTKIVKPLREFGARASVGYRNSDGDFPVYEDYFFTNDSGELNASLSLSLLRNRDIDPERFSLAQNEIALDKAYIDLLETRINVQMQAYKSYLDWLALGKQYKVYQSLLQIAIDRQDALKERARRGDIPQIAITENRQFILQRQETLLEAQRKFENAGNKLSMFVGMEYSDDVFGLSAMPKKFPIPEKFNAKDMNQSIAGIIQRTPSIQKLGVDAQMADNQVTLGENNILPAVDLEVNAADDLGRDTRSRDPFESTARLSVSIPLQTRFGQGRINKGQALKKQIENKRQLELQKLRINFENILNNYQTAHKILGVTEEEIEVTQKMEVAERSMFDNGQSDFFLVNIREVNKANAQINNIGASKYKASVYADFLAMSLNLDGLKLAQTVKPK